MDKNLDNTEFMTFESLRATTNASSHSLDKTVNILLVFDLVLLVGSRDIRLSDSNDVESTTRTIPKHLLSPIM